MISCAWQHRNPFGHVVLHVELELKERHRWIGTASHELDVFKQRKSIVHQCRDRLQNHRPAGSGSPFYLSRPTSSNHETASTAGASG